MCVWLIDLRNDAINITHFLKYVNLGLKGNNKHNRVPAELAAMLNQKSFSLDFGGFKHHASLIAETAFQ